jgi:hypothetical protein
MTDDPKEEYRALVKRTVQACNGKVGEAALYLEISAYKLSRMLNHRGLVEWWVPYKAKVQLEKLRARHRRCYQGKRERQLIAQGLDPTLYKPRKGM